MTIPTMRVRAALAFLLGFVGARVLLRRGLSAPAQRAGAIEHASLVNDALIATDHADRIVLANAAAAALFGVTVEQMQGRALSRFLIETPAPGAPARAGRRFTDYAVTGMHADGRRIALTGSLSQDMRDGRPVRSIILRDVSARQRVQARLARSHDELRQLSAALQTIREQERTHIARELHDDLGQLLASLRMDLTLLQQADGSSAPSLALMAGMQDNLATAIASLRRIATNLRPRALDDGGLYFALQGLRDDFSRRYGIACKLYADEDELQLDDTASTAIFRIVQEALTNIARHAEASNVTLNVFRLDGELLVTIRDDGRGISPADLEKTGSLGLIGMRERVWGMQGEIIVAAEAPGTRIDIVLPIRQHLL
ncbi:PAS domain-containing sensor histidine kinase [Massilia sp. S19_KUP03_FR1]|uniref:PAS domain-containing sensor histidine kinase n=1 Tax=Massilia sp. S19_KUP03_FR1 TaxID=3025503 RepID=UPI002FCD2DD5